MGEGPVALVEVEGPVALVEAEGPVELVEAEPSVAEVGAAEDELAFERGGMAAPPAAWIFCLSLAMSSA